LGFTLFKPTYQSHTKSGLVIPVITQSAQADFVCVAAISIAVAKGGNKGEFGISTAIVPEEF